MSLDDLLTRAAHRVRRQLGDHNRGDFDQRLMRRLAPASREGAPIR